MKIAKYLSVATFLVACTGDDKAAPADAKQSGSDAPAVLVDAPVDAPPGKLVINEVQANGATADWVELYNGTNADIDLSTYYFVDTNPVTDPPEALTGTIATGAHRVLLRKVAAVGDFSFGLKNDIEGVKLFSDNGVTVVDEVSWSTDPGFVDLMSTFGRYPDGTGDFAKMAETKAAANTAPL